LRWVWTDAKNLKNKRDHRIGFETAKLVFDDPLALTRRDPHPDGDRWQTIGRVDAATVLVIHTSPEIDDGGEVGRIISSRKATSHERRAYEEGDF
jgi:uncharacterized DUF497 family protein